MKNIMILKNKSDRKYDIGYGVIVFDKEKYKSKFIKEKIAGVQTELENSGIDYYVKELVEMVKQKFDLDVEFKPFDSIVYI